MIGAHTESQTTFLKENMTSLKRPHDRECTLYDVDPFYDWYCDRCDLLSGWPVYAYPFYIDPTMVQPSGCVPDGRLPSEQEQLESMQRICRMRWAQFRTMWIAAML
jgi:hypothetical protein